MRSARTRPADGRADVNRHNDVLMALAATRRLVEYLDAEYERRYLDGNGPEHEPHRDALADAHADALDAFHFVAFQLDQALADLH